MSLISMPWMRGGDDDRLVGAGVDADLGDQHEEDDQAHDDVDQRRDVDAAFL